MEKGREKGKRGKGEKGKRGKGEKGKRGKGEKGKRGKGKGEKGKRGNRHELLGLIAELFPIGKENQKGVKIQADLLRTRGKVIVMYWELNLFPEYHVHCI